MAIPAETLQTMQEQFQNQVKTDGQLNRIRKKIQNGGTFKDAEQYGMRSGQLLSKTLKTNITADLFEDGESLDVSNLASAIIPMMEQNYGYVSQAAAVVQKAANTAGGLGMNPVKPEFDRSAAMNIVGRMANYYSFEDAEWMLDEPMVANSVATVDRTLHDNADFQYRSGLKPKIIRTCEAGACPWCQELEGEYDYEEVKERNSPVYQRHSNCMCEVTFEPGDGRVQDVYSKQWYDEDKARERVELFRKETRKNHARESARKAFRMDRARSGDNIGNSLKTPGKREIEAAIKEQSKNQRDSSLLGNAIINNHKDLKFFSPKDMQILLENEGIKVNTLSRSKHGFNNKTVEQGGGFTAHFGGDGIIQYHPEGGLHKIAYWKVNTGKGGKHHYDINGKEFVIAEDGTLTFLD